MDIVNNKEIYGKSYGKWPWVYQCNSCSAFVGMHPYTDVPLGTLADSKTRKARVKAKREFEKLYKLGYMTRNEAYKRLAQGMGIEKGLCHFGWFEPKQCEHAEAISVDLMEQEQDVGISQSSLDNLVETFAARRIGQ